MVVAVMLGCGFEFGVRGKGLDRALDRGLGLGFAIRVRV